MIIQDVSSNSWYNDKDSEAELRMVKACSHIEEILKAQIDIIERHVDQHKWFHHIENRDEAIADFIEKYGFIMREFYCARICEERFNCEIARELNPK